MFTRIKQIERGKNIKEVTGYEPPILIDCIPSKRLPDKDGRVYSELSGPGTAVTWADARTIMALTKRFC